jgi:3-dehydroquinate synthase
MEKINVSLGDRSYRIWISGGSLGGLGKRMAELGLSGRAAVVTNRRVAGLYYGVVEKSLRSSGFNPVPVLIGDGERFKSLETMWRLYDRLLGLGIERSTPIVALGGGVVGDVAGFAASTCLRGLPLIQVPTTLLAQVDSSVGGKTGVDHRMGKNLIGAFYQPKLVLVDVDVLRSLTGREFRNGMAEVVKYGAIRDLKFFEYLEGRMENILKLNTADLVKTVGIACATKAGMVSRDERESTGLRALLNFGHTVGHGIEAAMKYRGVKHGEAVAIGMVKAAEISERRGFASELVAGRLSKLLERAGLPTDMPRFDRASLIKALRVDKKIAGGINRMILLERIGKAVFKEVKNINEFI